MSPHGIPIGRVFGIRIDLDYSWFLIMGLMSWALAVSYYPAEFKGWSPAEYWLVGAATALMLFVSVLIHELAHSLMAKRFGIAVPRITLFLFGGVAQIAAEPPSPAAEFWIALVGPVTSLALAAVFWWLKPLLAASVPLFALAEYLATLNLVLALFNLLPGFPLDGGRVLRALVWRVTKSYMRATMAATVTGRFFGFLLIFVGMWQALSANLIGGMWIAFIGWFLESAAGSQLQQEILKHLMGGHKVRDAMERNFVTAPEHVSLQDLVEMFMLPANAGYVVLATGENLAGLATLTGIQAVPREQWANTPARSIMVPLEKLETTDPNTVLWSAFEKMGHDGVNELPVLEGGRVVGVLTREDVVHYLSLLKMLAE